MQGRFVYEDTRVTIAVMSMKKYVPFFAVAVFLLAGAGIFYVSSQTTQSSSSISAAEENDAVVSPSDLAVGESAQNGGYTIERLPDAPGESSFTPPSLNRPAPPKPTDMDAAAYAQILSNMTETITVLKAGSDFNAWMNLASYYSILGDFKGTEEVLVFLTKQYTPSWQVYANLGNLYANNLIDLGKAVTAYREAITLLPNNPALYRSLYDVYARQENSRDAIAVLKEGIAAVSNAIDLYVVLARHYKSEGQFDNARTYYNLAITKADAAGNASLKADLESELSTLPG